MTDAINGINDPGELGYEAARDELIAVVKELEQGGLGLDASLALWERGEALAHRCSEHLAGARKRVEDVVGSVSVGSGVVAQHDHAGPSEHANQTSAV